MIKYNSEELNSIAKEIMKNLMTAGYAVDAYSVRGSFACGKDYAIAIDVKNYNQPMIGYKTDASIVALESIPKHSVVDNPYEKDIDHPYFSLTRMLFKEGALFYVASHVLGSPTTNYTC